MICIFDLKRMQKSFGTRFFFLESNQLYLIILPVVQKGSLDLGKSDLPLFYFARAFYYPGVRQIFSHYIISHRVRQVKTFLSLHNIHYGKPNICSVSNFERCQISRSARPASSFEVCQICVAAANQLHQLQTSCVLSSFHGSC